MQTAVQRNLARVVLHILKNYIKYLLSVPAVVLHFFGLCFGIFGLFYLVLADRPEIVNTLVVSIMGFFDLENVSYHGDPTPYFLAAYLVLGLLLDIGAWIFKHVFHVQWRPGFWKTFGALCLLSGINYGLTWIAFQKSSEEEQAVLVLLVFFVMTAAATLFALGSAYILDRVAHLLEHVKIRTVTAQLATETPVVRENTRD